MMPVRIGGLDSVMPRKLNTASGAEIFNPMRQITGAVLKPLAGTWRGENTRLNCLLTRSRMRPSVAATNAGRLIKKDSRRNTGLERVAAEPGGAGRHSRPERDHHRLVRAHDVHSLRRLWHA